MKVKTMDLRTLGVLHKDYSGAWGIYHREKDEIWLDRRLKEHAKPSKKEVLFHEEGHRKLQKAGVSKYFTDEQEEAFCDLWAIYKYPKKRLDGLELLLHKKIKAEPTKEKQIKAILRICGLRPAMPVVTAIVAS